MSKSPSMNALTTALDHVDAAGAVEVDSVRHAFGHLVQITHGDGSAATATVKVELSLDGEVWTQWGDDVVLASIGDSALLHIDIPVQRLRINVSSYTSGFIVAKHAAISF